jgi:hypothetical protein
VLKNLAVTQRNGTPILTADLVNQGYDAAENAVVTIRNSSSAGNVLETLQIGSVAVGASVSLEAELPAEYLTAPLYDTMHAVYAEITSDTAEQQLSNNSDRIAFDGILPLNIVTETVSGQIRISVIFKNDSDAELFSSMFVALYDQQGQMLDLQQADSSLKATAMQQLSFRFKEADFTPGCTMKLFWTETDTFTPKSLPFDLEP